jgi:hypothetical protein
MAKQLQPQDIRFVPDAIYNGWDVGDWWYGLKGSMPFQLLVH